MKTSSDTEKSVGKKRIRLYCHGHIHKPQQVIPGLAAYAGALEPIDKNDRKAWIYQGEISERGTRFEFVPLATGISAFGARDRERWEMQKCGN